MMEDGDSRKSLVEEMKRLYQRIEELEKAESAFRGEGESLFEKGSYLRIVFQSAMDGLFVIDMQGRYKDVNPAGCRMFGYSLEEFLASDISLILFPEDVKASFERGRKHWMGESVFVPEYRMRKKDGSEIWVEMTVNPFRIGATEYCLGVKRDITARRIIEQSFQRNHEALEKKVMERAIELLKLNDMLDAEVQVRKKAEETLRSVVQGTSAFAGEDFLRSLVRHLAGALKFRYTFVGELAGEKRDRVRTLAVWAGGESAPNFTYELEGTPCENVLMRQKTMCWYPGNVRALFPDDKLLVEMDVESYVGVPLVDSKGDIIGILAALDDKPIAARSDPAGVLTVFASRAAFELERKRLEDERRKAADMLQAIMDNSSAVIFMKDAEGRYLFINRHYERLFNVKKEEVTGKTDYDLFPKEVSDKVVANDSAVRAAGAPIEFEEKVLHPDGGMHTYLSVKFPIPAIHGAVCGIATDITEMKKAHEDLSRTQKLETIGALAGGMAHDLNNILLGIIGNISVAREYLKEGDRVSGLLVDMEKAAERAKGVAKRLLTFSKGGEPVKEVMPITNLIRDCASAVLAGSNVRCGFSFPADLHQVEIDEGQMAQVFNNVILNAMQAQPGGGSIDISGENITVSGEDALPMEKGRYVKITVKDHGRGISRKDLPKVFEPFFTTKERSSGLGLAVSYSIIKKHNGYISVESDEGRGTAFHIYLPSLRGNEALAPSRETQSLKKRGTHTKYGSGKVLVMDDEEIVRDVAGEMLRLLGYGAGFAADGAEAIEMYKKALLSDEPFNAVLMDLTIPGGMGGREAIKKLLEIDPGVKAIVSSGYSADPIMSEYKKHGFKGVITKPYRVAEFGNIIKSIIENGE